MKQDIQNGMSRASVYVDQIQLFVNSKQRWNEDKCRCDCKEFIDKGVCDKGYCFNSSNCECEYDKSCDIDEYLDYSKCKCRKKLLDKLVEECTENIDETKLVKKILQIKMKIKINAILMQYIRRYFGCCSYSL